MNDQPDDRSAWVLFAGTLAILMFCALVGLLAGFAALRWHS